MIDLDWVFDADRSVRDALARASTLDIEQPEDLPAEWWVEWGERAAVRQFDGMQAREHAEAEALTEIIARMRAAGELP